MKKYKLILLIVLLFSMVNEIHANEKLNILFTVQKDEHMYLMEIKDNNIKVKMISTKIYLPIPCLNNEKNTINSINFAQLNPCLVNTVNKAFNTNITHYIDLDMQSLLKDLNLPKNTYNYKTLSSLTKTAKKIKNKFSLSVLADYKKYITTSLTFQDLYQLYKISKKKLKISYYYLNYINIDDTYLLLNNKFHKKTK